MAWSPSENTAFSDDAGSSFQPAALGWELVSMSTMSASTLGLPAQKPDEAAIEDETHLEEAVLDTFMDSSAEGGPVWERETHILDSCGLEEDEQDEGLRQLLVGPSHENPPAAESSSFQEEDIPVVPPTRAERRAAWWRRRVSDWQSQSKKYGTVLSLALMVAIVGIAIMGNGLYHERNVNRQLRLEVSSKEEKLNDVMFQMNRIKEAATSRRRIGVPKGPFF